MRDPITVVCPKCSAAIGGKCLDSIKDGSRYVEEFHQERIDRANLEPKEAE